MKIIAYHMSSGSIIRVPYADDEAPRMVAALEDAMQGARSRVATVRTDGVTHTVFRLTEIVAVVTEV